MESKIIFLINSLGDGGAEKVLVDIVNALFEDGVDVELICIEKNKMYQLDPRIKISFLTSSSQPNSKIKSLLLSFVFAYKLKKHMQLNGIDIVQSHLFRASYVNILAKILFKSHHVVQVVNHSVISRLMKEGIAGKINLRLIKWLYPFADKIISVSKVVQDDMQKLFSFKNDLAVIHNPFDLDEIQNLSKQAITDFNFLHDKKYIICVGRLIPLKRNQDLLYALSKLPLEVELLFVGNGTEKETLIKLSNNLALSDRVYFLDWVNNPYKYINYADLLVSVSESESFGNTIVEAFICKTAVISTSCGGPSEIINYNDGLLIEVGDITQLTINIEKVLFNKTVEVDLVKKGFCRAKDFSLEKIICEYKSILKIIT